MTTTQSVPRIRPGTRRDVGAVAYGVSVVAGRVAGTGPPNLFLTLGRHRRLFRGWLRFAGRLMPGGTFPRRETELVILRVAHVRDCAYERTHHKKTLGLTHDAFLALLNYGWPGNVREIDNLCAALITYARPGAQITLQDVLRHAPEVADPAKRHPDAEAFADDDASYEEAQKAWERELFRRRMERLGNDQARVSKSLGISRATFYRLLERSGLREG